MSIKEFQDLMKSLYFEKDKKRGVDKTLLRLTQEVAELISAILNKTDPSEEIADVIAWTISIANILDIDADKALYTKYPGVCPKCHQNPCVCKSI